MRTRVEILQSLISLDRPMSELQKEVALIGWDSDRPLAALNRQSIISVLFRYLNGQLSDIDVRDWADELDGRQDIEREQGYRDIINEVIYILSKEPYLGSPLSLQKAEKFINALSQAKYMDDEDSEQSVIIISSTDLA
jgi:hypothetical protein